MSNNSNKLPKFLLNKYNRWRSGGFKKNLNHLKKLAYLGQSPSTMIISCCDSRVNATSVFEAEEGDFFIHRNIANLVPPYSSTDQNYGTSSAIEYGVKELKVKHIIILGHTDCGGIKSGHMQHSKNLDKNYDFIDKWLNLLLPAFNNILKDAPEQKQIELLHEESIKISISNLISFPFVSKAIEDKNLSVHGLVYNIGSGELKFLNAANNKFELV
tara:strand:- start:5033 stop:5677 length:645 start_codon:yes stop_codon:yes gene_type:complete